jgi:GT2 family glycosyltransferase
MNHQIAPTSEKEALFAWTKAVLRPGGSVWIVGRPDEEVGHLAKVCVGIQGNVKQLIISEDYNHFIPIGDTADQAAVDETHGFEGPVARANEETIDLIWFTIHDRKFLTPSIGPIAKSRPAIVVPWVETCDLVSLSRHAQELNYGTYRLHGSAESSSPNYAVLLPNEGLERFRFYGAGLNLYRDGFEVGEGDKHGPVDVFIPSRDSSERGPYIAVSFYKNAHLATYIADGFVRIAEELKYFDCTILLYNDSPDDDNLRGTLESAERRVSDICDSSLVTNSRNMGFLETMNQALRLAESEGRDIILLNSDANLAPGALGEMLRVASLDAMIGFVSPRSNNATIATAGEPITANFNSQRINAELERRICATLRYLPRFQFVPTAVGFCLLIKSSIIRNFGVFDSQYGKGYNEENDLVMRAGRCGFRAALANWALTLHIGEQSFSLDGTGRDYHETRNRKVLDSRYPEYSKLIESYFRSSNFSSEVFLSTLRDRRIRLLIDGTAIFPWHNGTIALAINLIRAISDSAPDNLDISLVCRKDAADFHRLHELGRITVLDPWPDAAYEITLRIGQPFDIDTVRRLDELSPVNIFFMLDTIALDCVQLSSRELEQIWRCIATTADGLIYNSKFTQKQYQLRFDINRSETAELVSYHSLKRSDYRSESKSSTPASSKDYVLIVGNHFPHKNLAQTYRCLVERAPQLSYVVLGVPAGGLQLSGRADSFYEAGDLSVELVNELYSGALVVVFPSLYEGFGFPIQHALAQERPVYALNTEINLEIQDLIKSPNLRLYESIDDLIAQLSKMDPWLSESSDTLMQEHDWSSSAREVLNFCLICLNRTRIQKVMQRREQLAFLMVDHEVDRLVVLKRDKNLNMFRRLLENLKSYSRIIGLAKSMAPKR